MAEKFFKTAKWWETKADGSILCTLCPRYCTINNGQAGFCFIRQNINGVLITKGYGHPTGFAIDPIEKKPLNHFLPGSSILSFGTAGCNLGCKFCQNWEMSKANIDDTNSIDAPPELVIKLALKNNTKSIAYTYNDPTIFGEYVIDVSELAREKNIKNVLVTAGYIDKNARKEVYKYIDAANVDLKSFTENFYHKLTYAHLDSVLDSLLWIKRETDIWLEITTLLIPDENDSSDEITNECEWILNNLGDSVPLHFTAFHPDFKMLNKTATPIATLLKAKSIAEALGIKYCYIGNVHHPQGQTTFCPNCKTALIKRNWHSTSDNFIDDGKCYKCHSSIEGVWE